MSKLDEASDRLNAALVRAERVIIDKSPHVRASVSLGTSADLIFGKEGGSWGLYIEHQGGAPMPLLKASREYRVLAAHSLETLMNAIKDAMDDTTREVETAAYTAGAFADAYSTRSGDPNEGI